MRRDDIISDILIRYNYKKGVEVGASKGDFSKSLLSRWKDGVLFMVDKWEKKDEKYQVLSDCLENISKYNSRCHMMRMPSDVACKLFSDESLDFVYLDDDHSYDGFISDFNNWFPKVKKGGLIAGHNYMMIHWYDGKFLDNNKDKAIYSGDNFLGVYGINTAIDEIIKKYNIQINFTPELFSSWYFIK